MSSNPHMQGPVCRGGRVRRRITYSVGPGCRPTRGPLRAWRYRPSLTFEKNIPENWIAKSKFYVTEEIFYDSLLKRFSRNRFTVGINRTLSKQVSVDLYYMRQNDGFTRPGDLNVIGTGWRVKL